MRLFALDGTERLGAAVARAGDVELDPLEEREFESGEHKTRPLVSVRNEDVYILHSLAGPGQSPAERLVRLLFFIACCRDNGAARVTAVTPYLAYLRKDQQTKPRDPVNSRYVVQLLESAGADSIVVLDPHNKAAFQNAARCRSVVLDTRALFAARLAELTGERRVVFVSPDSGGMKRARALRDAFDGVTGSTSSMALMEKHRSDEVVSGNMFAGAVTDCDVVIVDDMISSGTTMLRAAEACRSRGAARILAVATHNLAAPGSSRFFTSDQVDRILVTDSIATEPAGGRTEIVSCAPLLAEAIQRLHGHGSINRLLNPQA